MITMDSHVRALQNSLRKAEVRAVSTRLAERQADMDRQRALDIAAAEEYREEEFDVAAGPARNYLAANLSYDDKVEFYVVEWESTQTSVRLSRAEAADFIAQLQAVLNGENPDTP